MRSKPGSHRVFVAAQRFLGVINKWICVQPLGGALQQLKPAGGDSVRAEVGSRGYFWKRFRQDFAVFLAVAKVHSNAYWVCHLVQAWHFSHQSNGKRLPAWEQLSDTISQGRVDRDFEELLHVKTEGTRITFVNESQHRWPVSGEMCWKTHVLKWNSLLLSPSHCFHWTTKVASTPDF